MPYTGIHGIDESSINKTSAVEESSIVKAKFMQNQELSAAELSLALIDQPDKFDPLAGNSVVRQLGTSLQGDARDHIDDALTKGQRERSR